jgi:hypothetical protein
VSEFKMYLVTDSDLSNIGTRNGVFSLACSAGTGLITLGLGYVWDAHHAVEVDRIDSYYIIGFVFSCALISYSIAGYYWFRRWREIIAIRNRTKVTR